MEDLNKKVLLMGKNGAGKTSMRSIIFANFAPKDTMRLGFTHNINQSKIRFLGNLNLALWDCGGQDQFMQHYFQSQRDTLFKNCQVLIYVFDVQSEEQKDMKYYKSSVQAIAQHSPNAFIFVLIHKMDLILLNKRQQVFQKKQSEIKANSGNMQVMCFQTSIWDQTLYLAWSQIVNFLIPNSGILRQSLQQFCGACEANQVVLFQKSTFLVISHYSVRQHSDAHRFQKISNIIKQFKLSCSKASARFRSMTVMNSRFSAYIDEFTQSTYIMMITFNPQILPALTQLNIQLAKKHFDDVVRDLTAVHQQMDLKNYLKRACSLRQMDLNSAFCQMLYIFFAPQKLRKITQMRKVAKNQWARDDPAFAVILMAGLVVSAFAYTVAFSEQILDREGLTGLVKSLFVIVFIHFLGIGLLVAVVTHRVASNHLIAEEAKFSGAGGRLELMYCFDVHCNAFVPVILITYVLQYFLVPILAKEFFVSCLCSVLLNLGSLCYYHYMICQGFSVIPFLKNTQVFLIPVLVWFVLGGLCLIFKVNLTLVVLNLHF